MSIRGGLYYHDRDFLRMKIKMIMNYFNSAVVENTQGSKDLTKNRSDCLLIPKIQKTKNKDFRFISGPVLNNRNYDSGR